MPVKSYSDTNQELASTSKAINRLQKSMIHESAGCNPSEPLL